MKKLSDRTAGFIILAVAILNMGVFAMTRKYFYLVIAVIWFIVALYCLILKK